MERITPENRSCREETMHTYRAGIDIGSTTVKLVILNEADQTVYGEYRRHQAQTRDALRRLLRDARQVLISGQRALQMP